MPLETIVEEKDLEKLKNLRRSQRTCFTKSCNKLDEMLKLEAVDSLELKAEFAYCCENSARLEKTHVSILDLLAGDEHAAEYEAVDEYRRKERLIKTRVEGFFEKIGRNTSTAIGSSATSGKYRLPKLEIGKFDGEARSYLGFWSQFSRVHDDEGLSDGHKFQYLLQAMVPGSRAARLIESFPPTAENYKKAIELLQERFGRKDLLVQIYVRELLGLVMQNAVSGKKCSDLAALYDKIESHLRALDSLGRSREKFADFLCPLVESCLPENVLRAWERYRVSMKHEKAGEIQVEEENGGGNQGSLEKLMLFLRQEVNGEEMINLARNGLGTQSTSRRESRNEIPRNSLDFTERGRRFPREARQERQPSAAALLNASDGRICVFCDGKHESVNCSKAKRMSTADKLRILREKNCCFKCFGRDHISRKCRLFVRCSVCSHPHNTMMCNQVSPESSSPDASRTKESPKPEAKSAVNLTSLLNAPRVLLQTLRVNLIGKNGTICVRALFDSGSQSSYITKEVASILDLGSSGQQEVVHSLFGGLRTDRRVHNVYKITVGDLNDQNRYCFAVLDEDRICDAVPSARNGPWIEELKNKGIHLTDTTDGGKIDFLIGADVAGRLLTGRRHVLFCGLVAVETHLGWTVMGKNGHSPSDGTTCLTSMLVSDVLISDLWSLDTLGILDPSEKKKKEELQESARSHFLSTVSRNADGRYQVHLPWLDDHLVLPDNFELANKRLESTSRKLRAEGLFQDYQKVFQEWEKEKIIEEVPEDEIEASRHYLPHRHVVKENSTTRIRPVFDASAKVKDSPSLNDCLEKGLNLIELVPSIVNRFRLKSLGVTADIRKAFLQISLQESDRNYLRFLWHGPEGTLKHYRHCRVVFGVSSSPFLLGSVLKYHLESATEKAQKGELVYPVSILEQLNCSFYVDNCLTSVSDEFELKKFIDVSTDVLAEGKFDLRGWEYTDRMSDAVTPTNVLGLCWDRVRDTLGLNLSHIDGIPEKVSKKLILTIAHKVFDPLGISSPVTLLPKLMLQTLWKGKLSWDEEVDPKIKLEFLKWVRGLDYLRSLEIPRWLNWDAEDANDFSLHFFCDASKQAYSSVVFVRVATPDAVFVNFLQAKTRVAPTGKKETTIARLELLGASISARLYSDVLKDFGKTDVYFWTDSTTVLTWILKPGPWEVFVHNRVMEIRKLTPTAAWRHVPGSLNPADLPSRGCSARYLCASRWWEGPSWLSLGPEEWPRQEWSIDEAEVNQEKKKSIVSSLMCVQTGIEFCSGISDYGKILRVLAWIYRFFGNAKRKEKMTGDLEVSELKEAERCLIRLIQSEAFEGVEDKRLKTLHPFVQNEVILIRSAIYQREDTSEFRTPAVLPGEHPIVKKLVMYEHRKTGHVGVSQVLNSLRERFWLLSGRRSVASVIGGCIICKRYTSKAVDPPVPPLTVDRVQDAAVFQVTGIDFAGPIILRSSEKAWICLFTCAVYRCVHLELVTSLSTAAFLQAFHRFVSRRGRPVIVYSDNGTNFVGARNALLPIDFTEVSRTGANDRITWKLIPPGAPWWGGWWERLIGMMKKILRRILGKASLTYEEMCTVLCNCEAILNDRPLTVVSADADFTALTPANFLREITNDLVPSIKSDATTFTRRLRYIQNLREAFRKRFRQEYLGCLKIPAKRNSSLKGNLRVGDIVLIGSNDKPRLAWPLGRIVDLYPGADGVCRRAKLRVQNGLIVRAVQSLYPLEVAAESLPAEEEEPDSGEKPESRPVQSGISRSEPRTRFGRVIREPQRLKF